MSSLIMGTFPLIFTPNLMACCCYSSFKVNASERFQIMLRLVFLRASTNQPQQNLPSKLLQLLSVQAVSSPLLGPHHLTARSPADTNRSWQSNSSAFVWAAPQSVRDEDTHESALGRAQLLCFLLRRFERGGSLSSCEPGLSERGGSRESQLKWMFFFAFKTWEEIWNIKKLHILH